MNGWVNVRLMSAEGTCAVGSAVRASQSSWDGLVEGATDVRWLAWTGPARWWLGSWQGWLASVMHRWQQRRGDVRRGAGTIGWWASVNWLHASRKNRGVHGVNPGDWTAGRRDEAQDFMQVGVASLACKSLNDVILGWTWGKRNRPCWSFKGPWGLLCLQNSRVLSAFGPGCCMIWPSNFGLRLGWTRDVIWCHWACKHGLRSGNGPRAQTK